MSDDRKKKDKDRIQDAPRQGSVVPQDAELTEWLHTLWHRNEFPERVEVRWLVNKDVRGELVYHQDFRPNDKLNIEQVTKLSNEIMAAAQHDCDCHEHKRRYLIDIIDKNRKAQPLTRGVGPLYPQRKFVAKAGEGSRDEDDEDLGRDGRTLAERYAAMNIDQAKWDKQRYDTVMGQLLMLQSNIIDKQQSNVDGMMMKLMAFFERLQDAEDRRLDRDIKRQKEELKGAILKDLFKTVRNIVPGLVSGAREGQGALPHGAPPMIAHSAEKVLVENFLTDCEEAKIDIPLFGEWEENKDGKLVPIADKPGIFTPQQFAILLGVRGGHLPPAALDVLLPDSGDPRAVTQEQMIRALSVEGMTEGIGMAIKEVLTLRQQAREAAAARSPSTNTTSQTAER